MDFKIDNALALTLKSMSLMLVMLPCGPPVRKRPWCPPKGLLGLLAPPPLESPDGEGMRQLDGRRLSTR